MRNDFEENIKRNTAYDKGLSAAELRFKLRLN